MNTTDWAVGDIFFSICNDLPKRSVKQKNSNENCYWLLPHSACYL